MRIKLLDVFANDRHKTLKLSLSLYSHEVNLDDSLIAHQSAHYIFWMRWIKPVLQNLFLYKTKKI